MFERKGFTLIELLVVISVIVLLMAILLPALRRARNHAKAAICQNNLKHWGQIMAIYTQENEGRLPDSAIYSILVILRGPFETNDNRIVSSYASISTEGIRCCPMATTGPGEADQIGRWGLGLESGELWKGEWKDGSTFGAWEFKGMGSMFLCSYGFNGHIFLYGPIHSWIPNSFDDRLAMMGLDTFSVKGSARIPVFLDATSYNGFPLSTDDPPRRETYKRDFRMGRFCINRHNGYTNGLFLDWSVKRIGLKELWTLKWHPQFNTSDIWTNAGGVQPDDWPKWMRGFKDY